MFRTGAGEFALWNDSKDGGECYYRHSGKYFCDYLCNKNYSLERTERITKTEYLKKLSEYGKILKSERM